ncbi:hypothetical protein GALMADRAFT_259613 [Galerina marginata CBS 339.88]|uniref:ubiquitinyl hydrolase 1 n=1 Tax=Galerina marginata (strain CBS 339.88) TaxID=685588 RepID=A0A067S5P3_GALM3|nr:hypothetical protein GALMADRAFT_259613 [Galerina marginata CBS 339.88]
MYDIEPWAVDHLHPHGLIFCFMWRKDAHRPADFDDPAAERVWFANQLSDDACATHAILNVLLNCPGIDLGDELRGFRRETEGMSPVMRGLAVTNSPIIRTAHNSLTRPSDIRASLNNITITTSDAEKRKEKERKAEGKPPPAKRAKITKSPKAKGKEKAKTRGKGRKGKESEDEDREEVGEKEKENEDGNENEEETYHFIGYVPAYGKVWELDGLKSGPLEVGELPSPTPNPNPVASSSSSSFSTAQESNPNPNPNPNAPPNAPQNQNPNKAWMSIVRPALRMKMEKYGGSGSDGSNIRFSLLAIVDDLYQKASDELEFLKRERGALERRVQVLLRETEERAVPEEWVKLVDPALLQTAAHAFSLPSPIHSPIHSASGPGLGLGRTYAPDFGARRMERDMEILRMTHPHEAARAWEACVREAVRARVGVEDELAKGGRANTDHIKRTFDYEPFIREFLLRAHREGLLNALLDRDDEGRKRRGRKPGSKG